jgi:hypothetical protein
MQARIYRPARNPMQSGAGADRWLLEFIGRAESRYIDSVMGWTGNRDTYSQVRLAFPTREEAERYAEAHDIPYRMLAPKKRTAKPKSYAETLK